MTYADVLRKAPADLLSWTDKEFSVEIPEEIHTPDEMKYAAKLLLKLSSYYSYLCSLLSYAKLETRYAKRNASKQDYEDMVDKKEIIQNAQERVKQAYTAISRAVTIKIENNRELQMNSTGGI